MIAPISSALKWHSHEVTKMHANPLFACTKRRVFCSAFVEHLEKRKSSSVVSEMGLLIVPLVK